MDLSISFDLVRQIQIKLREEVGLSNYNLDKNLSFGFDNQEEEEEEEEFWGFGANRKRPDLISFIGTEAYRRLLLALDLDGSEIVSRKARTENSRKYDPVEDGITLSDFLNLELKRHTKEEEEHKIKPANQNPDQRPDPVNISGIDLEDYFSDPKKEKESIVEKPSIPVDSKENDSFTPFSSSEEEHTKNPDQSAGDTWPSVDFWPSTSSIVPVDAPKVESKDDLFDDWQDFAGLRNVQDPNSSLILPSEKDSELSSSRAAKKSEDDFGRFFQFHEDSSTGNVTPQQDLFSGGTNELDETKKPTDSKSIVDELLSEMHDLSFMLDDSLSVSGVPGPSDRTS